jgi:hypothetical protein
LRSADFITLRNEQLDPAVCTELLLVMKRAVSLFVMDLCTVMDVLIGEKVIQLCLPETRINTVLKLGHDMPFGSHMAFRRTNDRISKSFFFSRTACSVNYHCMRCETCQLFAPARRSDLNVIEPIPSDAPAFGHLVLDCIGPFGDSGRFKYAFVITDINTRFPAAYALTNITAKRYVIV